jgi:hypothetical protein
MADKKLTQLTALTAPANTDILLIVDDPAGTPVSKKITLENLLGAATPLTVSSVDIEASGEYRLAGDTVVIEADNGVTANGNVNVIGTLSTDTVVVDSVTPSSSNNTVQGWPVGRIGWDANYVYVAISSSVIGRVGLDVSW